MRTAVHTAVLIAGALLAAAPAAAATQVPFVLDGSGTNTQTGCNDAGTRCHVAFSGTFAGTPIAQGTYAGTAVVLVGQGYPNGAGGICAPARGKLTLTATADAGTIVQRFRGTLCQNGAGPAATFIGHWTAVDGTGAFAGVRGHGLFTVHDPGDGTETFQEAGHVTY